MVKAHSITFIMGETATHVNLAGEDVLVYTLKIPDAFFFVLDSKHPVTAHRDPGPNRVPFGDDDVVVLVSHELDVSEFPPLPFDIRIIRREFEAGRKLEAIKIVRKATGWPLIDCKRFVEDAFSSEIGGQK